MILGHKCLILISYCRRILHQIIIYIKKTENGLFSLLLPHFLFFKRIEKCLYFNIFKNKLKPESKNLEPPFDKAFFREILTLSFFKFRTKTESETYKILKKAQNKDISEFDLKSLEGEQIFL